MKVNLKENLNFLEEKRVHKVALFPLLMQHLE